MYLLFFLFVPDSSDDCKKTLELGGRDMKNKDNKQNSKILINGSYSILLTVLLLAGLIIVNPDRESSSGQSNPV